MQRDVWDPFSQGDTIRGEGTLVRLPPPENRLLDDLSGGDKKQKEVLIVRAVQVFLSTDAAVQEFTRRWGRPDSILGNFPRKDIRNRMGFDQQTKPLHGDGGASQVEPSEEGVTITIEVGNGCRKWLRLSVDDTSGQ